MRTRWEQELIQALYRMGLAVSMDAASSSSSISSSRVIELTDDDEIQ